METSPFRGAGTGASPATSPNHGNHPLAPFAAAAESSPRRSKRQRAKKGSDDKGMKQLDLRQMQQRSPTKAARAAAASTVGSAEQQPIVIRDDIDKATTFTTTKKKTLRAARKQTGGDNEAAPACASSASGKADTAGDGGAVVPPSTLDEEKENQRRQTPVAAETTAAAGAAAAAGMAGWIKRPGARKAAAAEPPKNKAPKKTRARPARDATKGEDAAAAAQPAPQPRPVADSAAAVDSNPSAGAGAAAAPVLKKQRSRRNVKKAVDASESVSALGQATPATAESTSASSDPTTEQPPGETATSASTGGELPNARGRGRGKARQPRKAAKATRDAEEDSDLTTPTSSQDEEQQSSPSQRRSGRLQIKRDAALDKIREQEALLRAAALEQQQRQQLRDADQSPARGGSGSEGSEGHSSPGEQGWMWKSSAGRTRTKGGSQAEGEVRLASLKPRRRLPIAALPFTTDLPEAPAGQEKLMLRLKVPPSLQLEMRSLGEGKTQSAPASPAGGSRLRATKRSKRKRAGGSDDSGGEDGSYSANEATRSATSGNDNEPRRKRRRRIDAEKDGLQPAATAAKPRARKKAKDEVSEGEPQPVVDGEEFFMTKEQREAHRQARMKEKLKKRTEESKRVDLKLTHGKEAHPFLMPRKTPAFTSSSSGAASSSSSSSSSSLSTSSMNLSLSLSSSVACLPLPPPVPSHVAQLTAREEAFLASFGPATSAFLPPVDLHSTHSAHAPTAGPLFEGIQGMDQLRLRMARATGEQRAKSDGEGLASVSSLETERGDDAAMVVQVLDAIHALFPSPTGTDHGHERAVEAQHLLAAYRWKHDNASGGTAGTASSSESAAACRQLWTEKYRPRCARDVIDHGPGLATLAGWLARWKKGATAKTAKTKTKKTSRRRAKSDEDDDTIYKANLLLLQGHTGIGKTAAVYACAEEYGFRVLEINPSVERTGAHIKHLVEEATQSRNVASLSAASALSAVAPAGDSISPSPPTAQGEAARCSLVLFEEVDVVFATDKGFFSALRELLRIAKTPVVLTCNAVTDDVADLLRDVSPHIDLRFAPVRHAELLLHLQLVCLAEGLRCADVVAQTNDVKQLVEHVGGDVRRSLLALQFWLQNGGGGGFDYLSWLGLGDVAAHGGGHESLASLLLAATTGERLRLAAQAPMSMTSLLHCNLFSFFPRVGVQPELAPAMFVDSGMVSTTTTTTPTAEAPAQSAVAAVRDRALVPMMDGLDFLCDVLSFNDAASTERRKHKIFVHHGMDLTPDAMLGREMEAATAVLGLACLPAAFAEEHVEELAVPHKHNKQLTLREAHRAGYEAVYGEVVPRVQHVSRYGGIDCFGMAQHIAQLDALNHQAKEGRRKRRHVNCLGLESKQHAWLMRHAFPLVPPSLVDPIRQRDRLRAKAAGEGANEDDDDHHQPPPSMAPPADNTSAIPDPRDTRAQEEENSEECEEDDGVDGMEPASSQGEGATEEPSQSQSQNQSQEGVREEECSSQFISAEDEVEAYEDEDEDEAEEDDEDESEMKGEGEEERDNAAAEADQSEADQHSADVL